MSVTKQALDRLSAALEKFHEGYHLDGMLCEVGHTEPGCSECWTALEEIRDAAAAVLAER